MGGSQNQDPGNENVAADVAVLALRPLANLLLSQGIGITELYRLLKWAFVHEAAQRQVAETGKVNVSRLAVTTGLTRHDVAAQLRAPVKPVAVLDYDRQRSNRVLLAWHRDADFLQADGRPAPLAYEGERSFGSLTRRYSGDIPPRAMLNELLGAGAIREQPDGTFLPIGRTMRPADSSGPSHEALLEVGRRLHVVADAIIGSVTRTTGAPTFQDLSIAEGLDSARSLELVAALNRRSERFVELCRALLEEEPADPATEPTATNGTPGHRVGLFVSVIHQQAPAPDASPPPRRRRKRPHEPRD